MKTAAEKARATKLTEAIGLLSRAENALSAARAQHGALDGMSSVYADRIRVAETYLATTIMWAEKAEKEQS